MSASANAHVVEDGGEEDSASAALMTGARRYKEVLNDLRDLFLVIEESYNQAGVVGKDACVQVDDTTFLHWQRYPDKHQDAFPGRSWGFFVRRAEKGGGVSWQHVRSAGALTRAQAAKKVGELNRVLLAQVDMLLRENDEGCAILTAVMGAVAAFEGAGQGVVESDEDAVADLAVRGFR